MGVDEDGRLTFYASFGSGYRTTEYAYGDDGVSRKATRHPVFPDRIDGRGYVRIVAKSRGRARYLASVYFKNEYAGLYDDLSMWAAWMNRAQGYENSPVTFLRRHGSLLLGTITEDNGLQWEPRERKS